MFKLVAILCGLGLWIYAWHREAIEMSKRWMGKSYYVIRTPIFIPWDQMQYCEAKFPLHNYVRFTVPSNKATLFVPRETADLLLGRAGRRLSHLSELGATADGGFTIGCLHNHFLNCWSIST